METRLGRRIYSCSIRFEGNTDGETPYFLLISNPNVPQTHSGECLVCVDEDGEQYYTSEGIEKYYGNTIDFSNPSFTMHVNKSDFERAFYVSKDMKSVAVAVHGRDKTWEVCCIVAETNKSQVEEIKKICKVV